MLTSNIFQILQKFYKKSLKGKNKKVISSTSKTSGVIQEPGKATNETKETLKHESPEKEWIRDLKQSKNLQKSNNFKGSWIYDIDEKYSRKSLFHLNDTETIEVDFMIKKFRSLQYESFGDLEANAIVLPLRDCGATLMIILPHSPSGLPALESKLGQIDLSSLSERMSRKVVDVMVPKFSSLIRKAYEEENEEVIEGDPTTRIPLCDPLCLRFQADRPFMFALLMDSKVVFVGKKIIEQSEYS